MSETLELPENMLADTPVKDPSLPLREFEDIPTRRELSEKQPQLESGVPAQVKFLSNLMYALVFVLFIGFATMFVTVGQIVVDSWDNKASTYLELRDTVKDQNIKIDALTKEIQNGVKLRK